MSTLVSFMLALVLKILSPVYSPVSESVTQCPIQNMENYSEAILMHNDPTVIEFKNC